MKQECAITRDLLPLYLEGLAGPESAAFVRRHLEQCPDCRAEQERLFRETPREPELPVKRLRQLLLREKYIRLLATVLAVLAVAAAVFSRLSAPEYLSAGQAAPETAAVGDALCIVFSPAVRHVSCVSWTDETGAPVYQLEAWTTLLDGGEPQAGRQSVTLPRQKGMIVFYAQNNGQDDALLYGTAADAGGWALPRLALNYYGRGGVGGGAGAGGAGGKAAAIPLFAGADPAGGLASGHAAGKREKLGQLCAAAGSFHDRPDGHGALGPAAASPEMAAAETAGRNLK